MKTISSGLRAAIVSGNICTLFTLSTADESDTNYFTDHDNPITFGGNSYIPTPGLQRFSLKLDNTGAVSNQNVMGSVLDLPENELASGKWDSAKVEVAITSWQDPSVGKLIVFKGGLGIIQWTDQGFQADIHNFVRALAKNIGKVVMPTCRHVLYDIATTGPDRIGSCGVNPESFKTATSVSAILSPGLKFNIASTGRPDGWGTSGFVRWTSGANNGTSQEVKVHKIEGGYESVEFLRPSFLPIAVSDTFDLLAGCDHTLATCKAKFNNVPNYGGFPHLQVDVNANINVG